MPQVPEPSPPPPETAAPTAGRAVWRWLVVWLLLTGVYAALGLAYRAFTGTALPLRTEDLVHWTAVPAVQTVALALVARLRRKP